MEDNAGDFYILNNSIIAADKLKNVDFSSSEAVYEIIRIIDKVPLFLEDHLIRLVDSLSTIGSVLKYSIRDLKDQIDTLLKANGLIDCNIKITVYTKVDEQTLLMYISKSYYPSKKEFDEGVKVSLMKFERNNPQVKRINTSYKEEVNRKISEADVFEVLLVNNEGYITEGSRSNVFFIKDKEVFTSPEEFILKGITRKYIIEVCEELGYRVVEKMIEAESLDEIAGLFISGTSIKVLPVSSIDSHKYSSSQNSLIIAIRERFDRYIDEHIIGNKC